jgi:hypothetical protein
MSLLFRGEKIKNLDYVLVNFSINSNTNVKKLKSSNFYITLLCTIAYFKLNVDNFFIRYVFFLFILFIYIMYY